jgi:hypothetical protein
LLTDAVVQRFGTTLVAAASFAFRDRFWSDLNRAIIAVIRRFTAAISRFTAAISQFWRGLFHANFTAASS